MASESSVVINDSIFLILSADSTGNSSCMMEIFCCSVRAEGRHFKKLHTFATTVKEYWEISQHIFSSFVSFPRFPGGNPNKSTSDNDLYESWTFLEVALCLLASDCRSSKLGNKDFFLLVDMVIERGQPLKF